MTKQKGFSLMELVIVLAIILVIAGLAIPSLIHMKINANETSARASIKAIQTAQTSYQSIYPEQGFASSLAALGGPEACVPSAATACLLDEVLAAGVKDGYIFSLSASKSASGAISSYVIGAAPESFNRSGVRRFCATEKNLIRFDPNTVGSTTPPTAEECASFHATR